MTTTPAPDSRPTPEPPDGYKTWLDYRLSHMHPTGARTCWMCDANKHVRAEFEARVAELTALAQDLIDCANMAPGCKNYNVVVDAARRAMGGKDG